MSVDSHQRFSGWTGARSVRSSWLLSCSLRRKSVSAEPGPAKPQAGANVCPEILLSRNSLLSGSADF